MMSNVNCKRSDGVGGCNKKPRRWFGLFAARCSEIELVDCDIAERYPHPIMSRHQAAQNRRP